jgi:hypothetical protein
MVVAAQDVPNICGGASMCVSHNNQELWALPFVRPQCAATCAKQFNGC